MFTESVGAEVLREKPICRFNETSRGRYKFCSNRFITYCVLQSSPFSLSALSTRKGKQNLISLLFTFYSFVSRRSDRRRNCAHFGREEERKGSAACHLGDGGGAVQMEPRPEICSFLCQSMLRQLRQSESCFLQLKILFQEPGCQMESITTFKAISLKISLTAAFPSKSCHQRHISPGVGACYKFKCTTKIVSLCHSIVLHCNAVSLNDS